MTIIDDFLTQCEEILSCEQRLRENNGQNYNELSLEAEKEEIQTIWADWRECYKKCIADSDCNKKNKEIIKEKKTLAHDSYITCIAIVGDWKDKIKSTNSASTALKTSSSISVPPCDTEVFHGDYVSWPSFRDLFTAIYINNKKLSSVEKLYHLFQKTSGEAREINRNIPLTAEGFSIAWENLKSQYENKRILINTQLRNLFNLAPCTQESANGLKKLQRDITNCIAVLELYSIDVRSWDPIFVYQCSAKMPRLSLSLWEQSQSAKTEMPRWEELNKFLTERFHALESVSDIIGSNGANATNNNKSRYQAYDKSKQTKVHHTKVDNNKCSLCKGVHGIKSCPKFLNMDFNGRLSVVKREKRCINCLALGHRASECTKGGCGKCNLKHHTIMHKEQLAQQTGNNVVVTPTPVPTSLNPNVQSFEAPTTSANVRTYLTSVSTQTLLATACINIMKDGQTYTIRALIDPCSDDSFITAKVQKMLKLPTKPITADIVGLGGECLSKCSKVAILTIGSLKRPEFFIETDALVVPDVTGNIPTHTFDSSQIEKIPNIEFADPTFYKSGPVDMLIGGNLYPLILRGGVQHGILGSLVAQETVFGWILTGPTNNLAPSRKIRMSHHTRVSVENQLIKFWEIEEVPKIPIVSEEDQICENVYKTTTSRNSEGRYVVDLPFKSGLSTNSGIGPSRYVALSQFLRNEKSLTRKMELKSMYDDVILEYLSLGHMEKVAKPINSSESCFYLPHHGVFKPESTTTKLRVVFNASCPSANGKSLNDLLYVGPTLQKDIVCLILNWRLYKFVFNADITKMYRQILVNANHAPYQRILFRTSEDEEIQDFQMKTVTFGVNCAPYLALRTLLQLAEDEKNNFPLGAKILKNNMYVDDALVGSHTIAEGIKARDELVAILASAKFDLRKWTSNHKALLENIPREHLLREEFLEFDEKSSAKTLGIRWNGAHDSFYFATENIQDRNLFTKREVLSVIARLFDPLGWLSPVIVSAKILMQHFWLDEIGWDDHLKPVTLMKWRAFTESYSEINAIAIPRWVNYSPVCSVAVHGFCDSSELAYAAALYLRVEIDGKIYTSLLVAKTKVAPIKKISLPRLELCGALLLANLADTILPQIDIPKPKLIAWSDSTIVLAWLKKPSHNWTTFVANRVALIQEKVGGDWHHVPTLDNPADLATRGLTPLELKENNLWWHGPPWLKQVPSYWPARGQISETSLEARPTKVFVTRSAEEEDILIRFSRLTTATHVVAYIFRFFHRTHPNTKGEPQFQTIKLSAAELKFARCRLMSLSQRIHFPDEYNCLLEKRKLSSNSPLLTLNPFLDKDQLIRANGRLGSTSSLSYNERHPIILAHKSRFALLYVAFVHKITQHGGNQLTLATIRLECWIIRARPLIKSFINNCKECVLARKNRQGQLMAALPEERTTLSRPFAHTGVDFAGPFDFKNFSGRGCRITKGYICLFVCFATKAIHLEPVSDLSTAAFLAALSRFVSRRGCPSCIYSDNGRNFVGASKELKSNLAKVIASLKDESVAKYGFQRLQWHFIPAAAPHMGGLWEAGVKSCKTHLKKMSGQIRHTYEEFATILAAIEACLNSRPLTPMSEDIDDLSVLTPGHFLVGSSLLAPAEPEEIVSNASLLNRWRRLKVVKTEFCKRWKTEYLRELHKRNKWKRDREDLKINDLVVLRTEALCPTEWRLGRVIKTYCGKDNKVRVVDLRTQAGLVTRPIHKLVLLPQGE